MLRRLPARYAHPWTTFGAGNVALHAVSLDVDLWKSRDGLRRAERIDPATIPSRERRGRFFVELARGHHAAGDQIAATRVAQSCRSSTLTKLIWRVWFQPPCYSSNVAAPRRRPRSGVHGWANRRNCNACHVADT